ncbi:hypothetical protein HK102_002588 [Quaeritorhiza haematococci]|nr:hypothetical protein HK102_002588 [Quaeritorhiza haematococci]
MTSIIKTIIPRSKGDPLDSIDRRKRQTNTHLASVLHEQVDGVCNIGVSKRRQLKLVVVGDLNVGKTCLLSVFAEGVFLSEYVPTIFENRVTDLEVDGVQIELALWDTAGSEHFDRIRTLSYPDANVVLICFSVDDPATFKSVTTKWVAEVRHFCPDIPILLVGNKTDMRPAGHSFAKVPSSPGDFGTGGREKGHGLLSSLGRQLGTGERRGSNAGSTNGRPSVGSGVGSDGSGYVGFDDGMQLARLITEQYANSDSDGSKRKGNGDKSWKWDSDDGGSHPEFVCRGYLPDLACSESEPQLDRSPRVTPKMVAQALQARSWKEFQLNCFQALEAILTKEKRVKPREGRFCSRPGIFVVYVTDNGKESPDCGN